VITNIGGALATPAAAGQLALGGGGLAHWIVRLFIWHELFRLFRVIWHIRTFGPIIVLLIIAALIGLSIWKPWRGTRWPRRSYGGMGGPKAGPGPRDW
jgi:hypothetical protein